jgi:hypothetical protein
MQWFKQHIIMMVFIWSIFQHDMALPGGGVSLSTSVTDMQDLRR